MLYRLAIAAALGLVALTGSVDAQTAQVVPDCAGVVAQPGAGGSLYTDQNGKLCVAGSASDSTASAIGGVTVYRVMSTADTNARNVKASGGRLFTYTLCNAASAARFVRFFDLATMPVAGTSPVYLGAIVISASTCQSYSNGIGLAFPAGIGFDITAANGDADTTAVAAGDVSGFIGYR